MALPDDPSKWSKPAPDPGRASQYREYTGWWFGDVLRCRKDVL